MGKKKKKGGKNKNNLSIGKFRNKICKNCQVCTGEDCSFCYEKYKESPHQFWRDAVPQLQSIPGGWPIAGTIASEKELDLFTSIFCDNVCIHRDNTTMGDCRYTRRCFSTFEMQLCAHDIGKSFAYASKPSNNGKRFSPPTKKGKKKKHKKHKKVKMPAIPTFFCEDGEAKVSWEVRIKKAFNANTNSKQNKADESATAT